MLVNFPNSKVFQTYFALNSVFMDLTTHLLKKILASQNSQKVVNRGGKLYIPFHSNEGVSNTLKYTYNNFLLHISGEGIPKPKK
jgi:hypothetical protein